jgi:hypothetical protein
VQLNDPAAQDQDVEAVVEGIANGVFSVLATLGVVPVIRCARYVKILHPIPCFE